MPAPGAESTTRTVPFQAELLGALAATHRQAYASATPFPHVVIDDFMAEEVLDQVLAEFPSPQDDRWWRFDSPLERKLGSQDPTMFGPATRHLLEQFNTAVFLDFLRDLTGIDGLVPDPHFFGGGLHQTERGGHLDVHADFGRHPVTGLERRLNLLVYLNREWRNEYGGALELWDPDGRACKRRILPRFNRCVVFTTTSTSFHGHPHPLDCPPDMARRSLALYYFSREHPPLAGRAAPLSSTRFRTGPPTAGSIRSSTLPRWARRLLPPLAVDAAGRARDRVRSHRDRPAP